MIGWLVIDAYFAYFFKTAIRMFRFFESLRWERSRAFLTDWTVMNPVLGCPSVRLHYSFGPSEPSAAGSEEVPFLMYWHAKTYAESLSCGLRPMIRVNPTNPQETRFFELDQKGQASDGSGGSGT
jgi:hypothetical protein